MDMISQRNLLGMTLALLASAFTSATAGGAGDNTAIVGSVVDRVAFGVPLTCVVNVAAQATLGAGATLSLRGVVVEDSADGVAFAALAPAGDLVAVMTGPAGGGTVRGVTRLGFDLTGARRYLRVTFTPDLSAANTDTAQLVALIEFGGLGVVPARVG